METQNAPTVSATENKKPEPVKKPETEQEMNDRYKLEFFKRTSLLRKTIKTKTT